jgi:hypothetical protein
MADSVPPEIERRLPPMMEISLGDFRDDEVLEESAAERVGLQLGAGTKVKKLAGQTGVDKVKLRAFDETLVEIPVMRRESEDDETRLQHRDPSAGGIDRNAGVGRERGIIEKLSDPAGEESEKAFKGIEVADVRQASSKTAGPGCLARNPLGSSLAKERVSVSSSETYS